MRATAEKIVKYIGRPPEGASISAKSLLHLGSQASVNQALSRLARKGWLIRVARGVYVRPIESRFGERPPSLAKVVKTFAELKGETIASSGAAAANAMGITTQVPVRQVYLTSGPNRELRLGKEVIELQHAPPWQLLLADRQAGAAIRALAWLGPKHSPKAMRELWGHLPEAERRAISTVCSRLPSWAAKSISTLGND